MAAPAAPEPPGPDAERVERPSVDKLLERAVKRPICVVIGAAGWGKTTAVATWSRSRPTAWLRHEDHDGQADRLLVGLVEALRAHVSVTTPDPDMAVDPDQPSVVALCAWLHSVVSEDLVLVLDDLHWLQPDSDTAAVVESLCQRIPDWLHLMLISRRELPFSLQRLRGRGLVMEIYASDLAFNVAEVEALLGKTVGEDPPGLSSRVWEQTGGWPAAVHFAVEMLRVVEADQRLDTVGRLCRPGERFHGYLTEEVIGTAPEWVQQQLRKLAVAGQARSTTQASWAFSDSAVVLAELVRQGLVRRRDGGSGWALVRPLQDFFDHELTPPSGERKALHEMAAHEFLDRGIPADALRHLLAAGDHAGCAALLREHGDAMVASGRLDAVLEAAELPPEYLEDPRICRTLGRAHQVRGHWAQALQHFRRAGLDHAELDPALSWRVGLIAFAQGEFPEIHALLRRTRLDREDTLDETRVLILAATTFRMVGDLPNLRSMAVRARAAARQCGDPRALAGVHSLFALLAAAEGDWRQADAQCINAMRSAAAADDLLQSAWIKIFRAFHQFESGAPHDALADSEAALNVAERCKNSFFVAHALTTRGRALARLGLLEAAAADFATAIDLFQHIGSRFLAWPLSAVGDLHRTRGQLMRARTAYEEALALAEPFHDVFGLTSALIGLARVTAADDPQLARDLADRAMAVGEGLRKVATLLARGWVELIGGDRQGAVADANRAVVAARQRRDNPGLAEAITLRALAGRDPANADSLREAIGIWQETGCRLEEAATRIVAARIDASIPRLDAHLADRILRDQGVDVESRQAAGPLGVLVRSAPAVFIQTLGLFRVTRNGVPVPNIAWKAKKARDLVKILIARRRPILRDQLMEVLWPGTNPAVSSNRLSVLLSTVRELLQAHPGDEEPLLTTDGAVSLNPTQVRVDVEDFLSQATAALEAHRVEAPDATIRLVTAAGAHTGDFLEDDPYQEWAIDLAQEVRATHIAVLRALVARLRDAGDIDVAVRYSLHLLKQDPYDEEAHLSLVSTLIDAGRLGQARDHYNHYVRRMREIDIQPSPLPNMTPRASRRQTSSPASRQNVSDGT
ncbi:MAG TPA: BTAD domain-containing putative transcriptional regulator [Pseudonocardiaceae bacterium]|nr:BTAD domain-containing putative transcriptional regulator [Pseudonocardiaceae bacterium]